jgi:transposase
MGLSGGVILAKVLDFPGIKMRWPWPSSCGGWSASSRPPPSCRGHSSAPWGCFVRLLIRGPSGRKQFNVLGAIDAITHELTTVCNDTVINAEAVCDLLRALAAWYAGLPLILVLDNARYQRCTRVQQWAEELRIELLYLPAYSPNLNRIERLWKFVKKECLSCLKSLLTLTFQTFEKPQLLAG